MPKMKAGQRKVAAQKMNRKNKLNLILFLHLKLDKKLPKMSKIMMLETCLWINNKSLWMKIRKSNRTINLSLINRYQ